MFIRAFFPYLICSSFSLSWPSVVVSQEVPLPDVLIPGWDVELVLAEPGIVTPTACCFDGASRLLVVECHTHFPPDDYVGPKTDRIYALSDSNGDGRLDRKQVFHSGGVATMGLAKLEDGSIVVVTRAEVARLWDDDQDGVADRRAVLLKLKTEANYPHNGLGGVAVSRSGSLLVGLGENFGEPYELVAADGSKQVGSGEGGNIFRINAAGTNLQRVATGFWNPFGICFDDAGRIWTVGNDPDAMPPCRLLHVVEGGDYGFQFRFGRGGRHPLQAWNGELPGTLPYTAGTGEAACAIMPVADRLWVTSWGDNRIEAYRLTPSGSTWTSETEVVVQGGPDFRPVGLARGPHGAVYFTDWVDRDYSVHNKGRIWRLRPKTKDASRKLDSHVPALTQAEKKRREVTEATSLADLTALFDDGDRYTQQAAMAALAKHRELRSLDYAKLGSEQQRTGLLAAWRWRELSQTDSVLPAKRRDLIKQALESPDVAPRLLALRWAAEREDKELVPLIEAILQEQSLTPDLLPAAVAASSYLRFGTAKSGVRDPAHEESLLKILSDVGLHDDVRARALRMLPSDTEDLISSQLAEWLLAANDGLSSDIIRVLASRDDAESREIVGGIASNANLAANARADAIASLDTEQDRDKLLSFLNDPQSTVQLAAKRKLRTSMDATDRPSVNDLDAWLKLVGEGGDPKAGGRVFWSLTCSRCHMHQSRGAQTGPNLTSLRGQSRRRLLQSILNPSQEVSPLYAPWNIVTSDGKSHVGLKSTVSGVGPLLKFQGADGLEFEIDLSDIESQRLSKKSIMPDGLESTMTVAELRDLLAFLGTP